MMTRPLLLAALLAASPAMAHDAWQNGDPIPAWVKSACCGPSDAHFEPRIRRGDDGWYVDDLTYPVAFGRVLPSQDGHVWAFYNSEAGHGAAVYCLFMPMEF